MGVPAGSDSFAFALLVRWAPQALRSWGSHRASSRASRSTTCAPSAQAATSWERTWKHTCKQIGWRQLRLLWGVRRRVDEVAGVPAQEGVAARSQRKAPESVCSQEGIIQADAWRSAAGHTRTFMIAAPRSGSLFPMPCRLEEAHPQAPGRPGVHGGRPAVHLHTLITVRRSTRRGDASGVCGKSGRRLCLEAGSFFTLVGETVIVETLPDTDRGAGFVSGCEER